MYYEELKQIIRSVLQQGLSGQSLMEALTANVNPKKDFIKGKKQAFDAVMLHWWTHSWENDETYWESYLTQLEEKNY